jgi:hypothetical protein
VLLDSDLAALYGVEARAINQAVARNLDRFPDDFMFQLTPDEVQSLRSQTVILKTGRGQHRKYRPYAFTEQGIAMLSSVLRSPRAVEVNIAIMRTFVQLRRLMDSNRNLARKIEAMEKKYDEQFAIVFDAIKRLIAEDETRTARPKRRIGFLPRFPPASRYSSPPALSDAWGAATAVSRTGAGDAAGVAAASATGATFSSSLGAAATITFASSACAWATSTSFFGVQTGSVVMALNSVQSASISADSP